MFLPRSLAVRAEDATTDDVFIRAERVVRLADGISWSSVNSPECSYEGTNIFTTNLHEIKVPRSNYLDDLEHSTETQVHLLADEGSSAHSSNPSSPPLICNSTSQSKMHARLQSFSDSLKIGKPFLSGLFAQVKGVDKESSYLKKSSILATILPDQEYPPQNKEQVAKLDIVEISL